MGGPTERDFRTVMGRFATGVAVMTTSHGGVRHGATVNSVTAVSLRPLLVLVCLRKGSRLNRLTRAADRFALSVLGEEQRNIAEYFADPRMPHDDPGFERWGVQDAGPGCPRIADGAAIVECRLWAVHDGGDHDIFCGRVTELVAGAAEPLVFVNGAYRGGPVLNGSGGV